MNFRCTDTGENVVYFRASSRLFTLNSDWYFASREGDQGPFATPVKAEQELSIFLELSNFASIEITDVAPRASFVT
ncbi:MAG: DUF6316 family protein [Proteobacteria bacterium]|nr:DUF6316 family protein [Pseudomonadota bacterium]